MSSPEVSEPAGEASVVKPAPSTEPTVCRVCHQNEAKYKCIKCEIPSCSVACSTQHQATHPADTSKPTDDGPPSSKNSNSRPFPATNSIARVQNPFSALDGSKELETLFLIYPRLRSQLRNIYLITQPPYDSSDSVETQEPAQYHRGGIRGKERGWSGRGAAGVKDKGTWNFDKGTQDAIDALSRAKGEYGKGGEGIREYIALVLKLVNVDGEDVARMVQEEVAAENARIISQLLTGEDF